MAPEAPPEIAVAAHIIFGLTGNSEPLQQSGWAASEPGFTWGIDNQCTVRIPYQPGRGTLALEMTVTPMLLGAVIRQQRLQVTVNKIVLGEELLAGEATLGFVVPPEAQRSARELTVTLTYPDAIVPAELNINPDTRRLGVAVRDILLLWVPNETPFPPIRRPPLPASNVGGLDAAVRFCTALSPVDLMHRFESLGHNCEFGYVQRAVGAEPLGLLRFGGISPHNLLRGLDSAFEGIEDLARLRVFTERGRNRDEYLVRDDRYSAQFHTNIVVGDATPDEVAAKLSVHLGFLRRQFQEVLETGSRIFVLQHPAACTEAQVLPVLNLLRSYGRNVLLFVSEDHGLPPGSVEQLKPDLFHGFIDHLAPIYEAHLPNVQAWTSICANTYRLWREQGGGG
jgi:hypothetical protein